MESSTFAAVDPVRPVVPYVGGKRALARQLIGLIETIPHRTYAEPFVGGGGVFLRRPFKAPVEVINDWSQDVWTLFRVLQVHYQAFIDHLRFQITTRAEFERLLATDPTTLTDIQRAARFLYLQRLAFGGKVVGRNFGVSRGASGRFDLSKLEPMLADLHERLAGVIVERLSFDVFIRRYDRADVLFYCDPPYFGTEHYYGAGMFGPEDFQRLRDALAEAEARWIVSINDAPEIREIFAGFAIQEVGLNYRVGGAPSAARELIISNLKAV